MINVAKQSVGTEKCFYKVVWMQCTYHDNNWISYFDLLTNHRHKFHFFKIHWVEGVNRGEKGDISNISNNKDKFFPQTRGCQDTLLSLLTMTEGINKITYLLKTDPCSPQLSQGKEDSRWAKGGQSNAVNTCQRAYGEKWRRFPGESNPWTNVYSLPGLSESTTHKKDLLYAKENPEKCTLWSLSLSY